MKLGQIFEVLWFYIYVAEGVYMYSNEFMKFLYGYQKDDFKQEEKSEKIELKTPARGKLAKVYLTNPVYKK